MIPNIGSDLSSDPDLIRNSDLRILLMIRFGTELTESKNLLIQSGKRFGSDHGYLIRDLGLGSTIPGDRIASNPTFNIFRHAR